MRRAGPQKVPVESCNGTKAVVWRPADQAEEVVAVGEGLGSIRIHVETIGYFPKGYREDMVRNKNKAATIEQQLAEFEACLRRQMLRETRDAAGKCRSSRVLPEFQ